MSEKRNIARAAGVLGSATILSRIMGMVRDMVVSRLFGAGFATDAFFAAFQVPNMLRRFFAEGALTSAFVPIFSGTLTTRGKDEARQLANACFTLLTIVMAAVTLAGILFSPWIVGLMFPGFRAVPGKFELTVLLNRMMFPYIFFISLVALCMGILNTLRHFFTPAISTVFLNIAMILAALLLRNYFEVPITALAAGVLIGGILQLVLQLPVLWRMGFPVRPRFAFNDPEVRRIAMLMVPAVFGVGVYYLNITVGAILASLLPQGSVSYLYYAQRLFEFPQGIFTVSVAQAVLPSMSKQAAEGDMAGMKESLAFGLRLTLFITIPAMVGLMVCATPIFSLIFMGGAFDYAKAVNSAQALLYYSLGLSFVAMTRVLAPAFYSLKDTVTPVWTALCAFLINLGFSLALMGPLKHGGLALATTISALGNMLLLLWFLRRKIGPFGGRGIVSSGLKSLAASVPMAAAVWFLSGFADWSLVGHKFIKGAVLGGTIVAGIAVYLLFVGLLGSEEAAEAIRMVRKKLRF
ncbi:murein biosynthesis integral membrane protein MurJ [Geobacter sp. SVR]|uniref:murein biosynthesis integral membrane protein MurJ n=1 Tax=Geobacter sp. SVR TaxID=2495594 RepID=UPI00143EF6AA|nr:murein biosynthesis integral membrane protein MurJ [Geobacter sp. SVR]BCS54318.1 putative lipid II flippase MurJ [Geobacter sp. SVR]GCF85823.1 putative lipid II flippase MurJ [Geobacter sp. SVR]